MLDLKRREWGPCFFSKQMYNVFKGGGAADHLLLHYVIVGCVPIDVFTVQLAVGDAFFNQIEVAKLEWS